MTDITLTLKINDLLWDVKNDSNIIAQGRLFAGEKSQAAYFLQATDDDGDRNKLLRSLQLAVASLKTKLSPFVKHTSGLTANDQLITGQSDINIVLSVSERFNQAMTTPLAELSHKYVANLMMFDWFNATAPTLAKNYFDIAQMAAGELNGCFIKQPPTRQWS